MSTHHTGSHLVDIEVKAEALDADGGDAITFLRNKLPKPILDRSGNQTSSLLEIVAALDEWKADALLHAALCERFREAVADKDVVRAHALQAAFGRMTWAWTANREFEANALVHACIRGDEALAGVILDAGIDPNHNNGAAFWSLLPRGPVGREMPGEHRAPRDVRLRILDRLEKAGLRYDGQWNLAETPLHRAASTLHHDVVQRILDAGVPADTVNRRTKELPQATPLLQVAWRAHMAMAECREGRAPNNEERAYLQKVARTAQVLIAGGACVDVALEVPKQGRIGPASALLAGIGIPVERLVAASAPLSRKTPVPPPQQQDGAPASDTPAPEREPELRFQQTDLGVTLMVAGDQVVGGYVNGRTLMLDWYLLKEPVSLTQAAMYAGGHAESGSVRVGKSLFRTTASNEEWSRATDAVRLTMTDAYAARRADLDGPGPAP